MTVAEHRALRSERQAAAVLEWRFSQLARSGYDHAEAVALATHPEVDLHEAADLLARGCPPKLALRILL
jgi:hypothetical protein